MFVEKASAIQYKGGLAPGIHSQCKRKPESWNNAEEIVGGEKHHSFRTRKCQRKSHVFHQFLRTKLD